MRETAALTGANRNTIKDHLRRLVDGGRLTRRGRGRGTWYEKPRATGRVKTANSGGKACRAPFRLFSYPVVILQNYGGMACLAPFLLFPFFGPCCEVVISGTHEPPFVQWTCHLPDTDIH